MIRFVCLNLSKTISVRVNETFFVTALLLILFEHFFFSLSTLEITEKWIEINWKQFTTDKYCVEVEEGQRNERRTKDNSTTGQQQDNAFDLKDQVRCYHCTWFLLLYLSVVGWEYFIELFFRNSFDSYLYNNNQSHTHTHRHIIGGLNEKHRKRVKTVIRRFHRWEQDNIIQANN